MPEQVTSLEKSAAQLSEEMLIRWIRGGEHDLFYR